MFRNFLDQLHDFYRLGMSARGEVECISRYFPEENVRIRVELDGEATILNLLKIELMRPRNSMVFGTRYFGFVMARGHREREFIERVVTLSKEQLDTKR